MNHESTRPEEDELALRHWGGAYSLLGNCSITSADAVEGRRGTPHANGVLLRRRRRCLVCVAPRAGSRAKDAAEPLLGGAVGGGGGGRALRREGRRARAAQPRHGQRRHRLGGALRRRVGGEEKGEVVGGACVTAAVGWRRGSTAQCGAVSASRDVDGREYRRVQCTSLEKVPLSSRRSRVLGLGAALCRLSLPPLSAPSREACSRRSGRGRRRRRAAARRRRTA